MIGVILITAFVFICVILLYLMFDSITKSDEDSGDE